MESLRGLRLLPLLFARRRVRRLVVFAAERHPYEPVPHPDNEPDTDQDDSEADRNTSGRAKDQHAAPRNNGRRDQEPSDYTNKHLLATRDDGGSSDLSLPCSSHPLRVTIGPPSRGRR